jgi:hypothetical protein
MTGREKLEGIAYHLRGVIGHPTLSPADEAHFLAIWPLINDLLDNYDIIPKTEGFDPDGEVCC